MAAPARADAPWSLATSDNNFGANRPSFTYTLNPGAQASDGVVVVNNGTTPLDLSVYAADAFTTRGGKLDLTGQDAKPKGVGACVPPATDNVRVPPGQSVEVPVAVALPKEAAPGDYVGGIVAARDSERVSIPIHLRVGGALKPSLAVENVHVDYSGTLNPAGKGDATVTYAIHNTGNAIVHARQTVWVAGPVGAWSPNAARVPDSPSLPPGESWKVSVPVAGVAPAIRTTATVTLVPLLTDAAGSTAALEAVETSGHAWTVPWALLVAILVVCGFVFAGVALRPRRRAAV